MSRTSPDRPRILLGAMSGTSADGVDVAAVEITGRGLAMKAKYLAHVEHPYDPNLRQRIFALRESGQTRLDELASLGRDITLAYVAATRELLERMSLRPSQVAALAAHGQTLYHAPPDTIQWLDPSLLAAETDLLVVSDFRRADLAAGGQGAPLVPFADWIMFRHPEKTRVILNIGGIANLTYLPAGGGIEDVIAFDTGPGMCISDWLMRTHDSHGTGFDEGGALAAAGNSDGIWRHEWLEKEPYHARRPPKSTDGPEMIAAYGAIRRRRGGVGDELSLSDELATVATIVSSTVVESMILLPPEEQDVDELIVAGGGRKNARIMSELRDDLVSYGSLRTALVTTDDLGLPAQAREAVAFAILGAATIDDEPSNVPAATGARRRVVLGSITPRPGQ